MGKKIKPTDYLEENVGYTVITEETLPENDFDLDEFMKDFDYEYIKQVESLELSENKSDMIFAEMSNYDLNYNMKQLVTICNYYNIICNKKVWKKMDYIKAIIEFEHNLENYDTVVRRKQMWFYMEELKNDKFMKQFILFL